MACDVVVPPRIQIQEYGEALPFSTEGLDLHALDNANKRWRRELGLAGDPIRVEDLGSGFVRLRAEAVTGVLRVGNIDVQIAPKFLSTVEESWQAVLWRILTVVEGGHVEDSLTAAEQLNSQSMPDLLADMFLRSYTKGAARGLPRGYQSEKMSGSVLRGSIDISRLGEWIARPWEVQYTADFLTDDTPLARLLRWSAQCLAATVTAPGRARALREITAGLAHVSMHPPHLIDAQRISLGIQHQALEPARIVGLLLLDGAGIHHASGEHALSGFLWNSDVIYEKYTFWLCQRAASQHGSRVDKRRINFGDVISGAGSRLVMEPDVVFRDDKGTPVAVIDSKYKRLGNRPKSPDTYQVLSAAHVLGCQRISLAYPVAQDREPTIWRISSALGGRDIELTVLPLNLMSLAQPYGPQRLIDTIGAWLKRPLFS
ncbi:5-methylcytosine restriction system specificity protein McrC [Roseovarius sp.]|uniref:5-methylcytosine restriction system specificity protein McrC n=1 Tax=Roseovarius sp. TaxID=1486281 RepID=UPI003B58EC2D